MKHKDQEFKAEWLDTEGIWDQSGLCEDIVSKTKKKKKESDWYLGGKD